MNSVSDILGKKGTDAWSVSPDATVFQALELMAQKEVGALLVVESNNLTGIISERDYARKVVLLGKTSKDLPVREIMSTRVIYVTPQHTIEDCMALMTDQRIRHLPVLDGYDIKGVISIGDVVKAIIHEKEFVIDQLVQYIKGTPSVVTEYAKPPEDPQSTSVNK